MAAAVRRRARTDAGDTREEPVVAGATARHPEATARRTEKIGERKTEERRIGEKETGQKGKEEKGEIARK